ncbi:hypothetical protein SDC9_172829 [bioreactor metagenome]|uniref:Uncharacterized protein n=1 Tax=bioreactor metagenome TaxID=1076179 RepID=A0A645GH01_9ZZZZ
MSSLMNEGMNGTEKSTNISTVATALSMAATVSRWVRDFAEARLLAAVSS